MRSFEIVDGRRRGAAPCATLTYDEGGDEYGIRIADDAKPSELPAILAVLVEQGVREVGDRWARRWVEERIVPPSRQNLGAVLRANDLETYDELALLVAGEGRCAQDDFLVREYVPPRQGAAERMGFELADLRRRRNLSQMELSRQTGVQQAVISRVEHGRSSSVELLDTLARALGAELRMVEREEGDALDVT